jgi:hypothetical protein
LGIAIAETYLFEVRQRLHVILLLELSDFLLQLLVQGFLSVHMVAQSDHFGSLSKRHRLDLFDQLLIIVIMVVMVVMLGRKVKMHIFTCSGTAIIKKKGYSFLIFLNAAHTLIKHRMHAFSPKACV